MKATRKYYATIFEGWQFPEAVAAQQRFRKALFVDQLKWRLSCETDREVDEFDTDSAVYCSLFHGPEIVGCWRATCTTEEYLSRKHFPQLAVLQPYPSSADFWEVSRLGAAGYPDRLLAVRYLYALLFHFVRTRRAASVGGVISRGHHRYAVMLGIRGRDYCRPQIVGHDADGRPIQALFSEILMAEQSGPRFRALCASVNELELQDETLVLGRQSIPA